MTDFDYRGIPVHVSRDAGYSKIDSISPEKRNEAIEKKNNSNVKTRIDVLDELFSKMGVIVHPERMTNWYAFTD